MARHQVAPPFTEKVLTYSTDDFPFLSAARYMLGREDDPKSLECLHELPTKAQLQGNLMCHDGFRDAYYGFVKDYLRNHFEEDILVFEAHPNLRVHYPHARPVTGPHTDGDYGHSSLEINFWIPLTVATGTGSLWAESSPGQGDFHPFEAQYGEAVRFYGSRCLHFSRENQTDKTRVSFDFRIVRFKDFFASGIPLQGTSNTRLALFSYYEVMGPDGIISEERWASLTQERIAPVLPIENDKSVETLDFVSNDDSRDRPRSPSCEHRQRCIDEWGSERAARTNCARCMWLQSRASLQKMLVYVDKSGVETSWVSENPDLNAPWGLGCVICNDARKNGLNEQIPKTAFSQFTFASGPHGVLCGFQPLFRHGNCARNQLKGRQKNGMPRLVFDEGHQTALRELGATAQSLPPVSA